jgi:hypothetical protein
MKSINKDVEKIIELKPKGFTITFTSKHEHISIAMQDSRDVMKLKDAYKELLDKLKIPYFETYKNDNE